MNVLLSIKPRYVEEILQGNKRFEFRKSYFKQDVEKVFIYSSHPSKEIVGFFTVGKVHIDTPERVWGKCGKHGSISRAEFFSYFSGKEMAVGIEIDDLEIFEDSIKPHDIFPEFVPPQSYYYLNHQLEQLLY